MTKPADVPELSPQESQILKGMVSLAAVFAEVLEEESPGLRGRLEAAAKVALHRSMEDSQWISATVISLFLQEIS